MDVASPIRARGDLAKLAARLRHAIPEGHALPEDVWQRRHRGLRILLVVQAAGILIFALARGNPLFHSLQESSIVAVSAILAGWSSRSRAFRAGVATFGLVTCSALLVHFSGGTIEAHFHFFAMIAVITLYQDWTPFLLALGFVLLHHGVMGGLDPGSVYNHGAAIRDPWTWALIHAVFVLFASVANLVAWRLNEASRAHAQLILNSAGEGIYGFDPKGKVTFANQAAAKMLERDVDDLVGASVTRFTTRTQDFVDSWIVEFLADGDAQTGVTEFGRPDGTTFPIEYVCTPIRERSDSVGAVVTFRDITERKAAEEERERTLSLLEATLESTADGILVVDRNGKISSVNRKFIEMWGIPDEVVASGDDDLALRYVLDQLVDPQGFLQKVGELYAEPDAQSYDELRFKDGRVFERYSMPQKVAGVSVGRVWSFHDATERHRLDEMKNGFLSAVSHELRTPLTAVLGYAVTLERMDGGLDETERKDVLARMSANARKLERLLSDTLDLDRLSRGILEPHRSPTDVGDLVRRVIEESEIGAERVVRVEAEQLIIAVDRAKVERIVENLVRNAVRHTDAGTPIWVRVMAEPNAVLIAVEDAGPGVPIEMRESIFESFRQGPTVASHAPGVGIGLALVSRFTELHGGTAWVEDRQGGGASFRVRLPGAITPLSSPHTAA